MHTTRMFQRQYSEEKQPQKIPCCVTPLCAIWKKQNYRDREQSTVARGWGGEGLTTETTHGNVSALSDCSVCIHDGHMTLEQYTHISIYPDYDRGYKRIYICQNSSNTQNW